VEWPCALTAFHAVGDERVSLEQVRGWAALASDARMETCVGRHLMVMDVATRAAWFNQLVSLASAAMAMEH
jgi:hypothetical protein